ncbi:MULTISPECIES: nitrate- and nitrite sensing domain-containing protein [unclassified Amycolatopsis]|uniref:sensor histidine kinase n=1 Tax=unclassified Amycolatopsis TaxID=2618356 RepID=UPI001F0EE938|nr:MULTISPECIES: nitrate- and nitrite sensing domain-containing protein [unclassified Amycolatopsis]
MTVAGEGQVPVEKLLGRPPKRPRWSSGWRAALRWRDWSLPVKLSAVTIVPIVLALVLGITAIAGQVSRSSDYQRIDRLVALSTQLRALTDGLQRERTQTAAQLIAGTSGVTPELKAARAATDAAVAPFTEAAARVGADGSSVSGAVNSANAQVNEIAVIRQQVGAGLLNAAEAVGDYNAVTSALIGADTAVSAGASADALGSTPSALHDLEAAKEQVSVTQSLVGYGISAGTLTPQQLSDVRDAELRFDDRVADFNAAATAPQRLDFESTIKPDTSYDRKRMLGTVLGGQGVSSDDALKRISAQEWNTASNAVTSQLSEVSGRMSTDLTAASSQLVEDAGSSAGLLAVLLFAALAAAAAVVFVIARQLLRSLKVLRRSALDVAEKDLPEAVRNIQEGRAQSVEVEPVPVQVQDEVGEVARAFEKVHSQALKLATEQAAMRAGYSSVFVNLSRRSQSLVQRQLQLIERLERDEEDADQLATLFQLDHLATRMRRNNENLMVLSGAEPGRRSGQPVATHDVLRAAVSEIEQYQRVSVQHPPAVKIVGFAASDVQRLIAELLDNATAFSAPETQVTVATRLAEDGSLNVDILDKGIGMNEYEVVEANGRLTDSGSVDLATSRRMGLFVVGRLAGRHRIGVSLHGGKDIVGVRATVVVPPELVMTGLATVPGDRGEPGQLPGPKASLAAPPAAPGGLPRRQRPASNGSAVPGLVPQQGSNSEETQRWPSAGDLAGFSGDKVARPPSDLEVSGTALFSPIPRDDDTPAPPPPAPKLPQTVDVPPPRPEPEPEPAAETRDERDGELPSGKDLFSAANATTLSDWWNQAAQQVPEVPPPSAAETTIENTPIFDEMLSAWFRSPAQPPPAAASPAASPASGTAAEEPEADSDQQQRNWDFASDENWRTVQALSQVEPTAFTKSGLPRRRRGEQLMPGSATPEPAAPAAETQGSDLPVRDPADVRGRLNSFQRGVTRGRQEVRGTAPETTGATADSPAADASSATTAPSPERARAHDAAVRRRQTVAGAFGVPAEQNRPGGMPQRTPGSTAPFGATDAPAGFGARPADADSPDETAPVPAVPPAFDPDGGWPRQEPAARTELPAPQPDRTVRPDKPDSLPTRRKGASSLPPPPPTADPNQVPAAVAGLEAAVSGTGQTPASQAAQASANGQTAAPEKTDSPASANGQASAPAESPSTEQTSLWGKPAENPGQASPLTTWRAAQPPAAAPGQQAEKAEQSGTTADPAPAASASAQGLAGGLGQTRVPGQNVPGQSSAPGESATPGQQTGLWGQPLVPGQAPSRQSSAGQDAPPTPAEPAGSDGSASPSTTPAEGAAEWNFGSDEGWRTVQSVSQSTPASFTSAGLPRRRRGEQLLPGSAPPPAGSASPRPSRDAHDVRGRLSSFQQGIQRGRHRTAQAAEKNHETLEGE